MVWCAPLSALCPRASGFRSSPTFGFPLASSPTRQVAIIATMAWLLASNPARATPFRRDYAGDVTQLYAVMFGAVTCVLLIVCANIAGLLLVRGAARQKE